MPRRIALVEDDPTIRQNYVDALTRAGYEVAAFSDRSAASKALAARLPELAIIDIGLGADIDGGFALCRDLRAASARLPIIFLSARDSDFDIVSGLRLGADDYLTKDVSLPHLLARIAALFRRVEAMSQAPAAEDVLRRGALALDAQRMSATWNGKPVGLTVTEFWMVHSMARHPGHVKDRDQLMSDAEMVVDDGTITSHVKRIRKKFLAVDPSFAAIETVYGMGYRWVETA
jgi:two-component system OmpR family response regulator